MNEPRMFYFGPWDRPGHFLFDEAGRTQWDSPPNFPWRGGHGIDGVLQPGCVMKRGHWQNGIENEGEALLHYRDGWTALSFWDRSVDHRMACNSTYFAEGTFTFDQMVEMAKTRFAMRWEKMNFDVRLSEQKGIPA